MQIAKKYNRISLLGFIKFFAAILIVWFHTSIFFLPEETWRFTTGRILVELFFIITGYFTAKHFQKDEDSLKALSINEKALSAIKYSIKKYIIFIPYILIAAIMLYLTVFIMNGNYNIRSFFDIMRSLPIDLLFLNSQTANLNWPIWFLSASIIVMPIIALLCQTNKPHLLYAISILILPIYYFNFFNFDVTYYPAVIRAFMGILAGVCVFGLVKWLDSIEIKKEARKSFSCFALLLLILTVFLLSGTDKFLCDKPNSQLILILFIILLSFALSKHSLFARVSNRFLDFLEKLSFPIYILHVPVIFVAQAVFPNHSLWFYTIFVYSVTITLSISLYCMIELAKIRLPSIKSLILENKEK